MQKEVLHSPTNTDHTQKSLVSRKLNASQDHAIELKPGAPPTLPGKIYALTQKEQQTLEAFLEEHQQKGYIRPSKSPYASPFFFIKKKDGKLQPVQDYTLGMSC